MGTWLEESKKYKEKMTKRYNESKIKEALYKPELFNKWKKLIKVADPETLSFEILDRLMDEDTEVILNDLLKRYNINESKMTEKNEFYPFGVIKDSYYGLYRTLCDKIGEEKVAQMVINHMDYDLEEVESALYEIGQENGVFFNYDDFEDKFGHFEESKTKEAGKGPQEYCVKLTEYSINGFQDLYTCFDLYQDLHYSSFKERIEDLPSLDDRKSAEDVLHLVKKDYFNKYQQYPIVHIVKASIETLEESKNQDNKLKENVAIPGELCYHYMNKHKGTSYKKLAKHLENFNYDTETATEIAKRYFRLVDLPLKESRLKEADSDYLKIGNMVYPGSTKTANMTQEEVKAAYDDEQAEKAEAARKAEISKSVVSTRKAINDKYEASDKKTIDDKINAYFDVLVPDTGSCDTKAGEIVRALNRIIYRHWNDGDYFNIGYGIETAGPAASFLMSETNDDIYNLFDGFLVDHSGSDDYPDNSYYNNTDIDYNEFIDELKELVIDYLDNNDELLIPNNKLNMFDYSTSEIKDFEPRFTYQFEVDDTIMQYIDHGDISERDVEDEVNGWLDYDRDVEVQFDWGNQIYVSNLTVDRFNQLKNFCEDSKGHWMNPWEYYIRNLESEYGYPEDWENDEE